MPQIRFIDPAAAKKSVVILIKTENKAVFTPLQAG